MYSSQYYGQYSSPTSIAPNCQSFDKIAAKYGRVGLNNLGNTCYMNTAIQCLSHIPCLVQFLVSDKYKLFVNKDNASGTKGYVITVFAELLQHLWLGSSPSVSPSEFKSIVSRFATAFQGYDQHDSQEFFITLLDLLHEDINCISKKPYIEYPTYSSFQENQSKEMWSIHLKRNDSQIIDWFYGQTVTFMKCSVCQEQRVMYEPYSFLTLPLPPEMASVYINILPSTYAGYISPIAFPSYVNLTLRTNASIQDVITKIAEECGVSEKRVTLYSKDYQDSFSKLSSYSSVNDLSRYGSASVVVAYILPEEKEVTDEVLLVCPAEIMLASVSTYGSSTCDYLPYSIPYCFLMKEGETSIDLSKKIQEWIIKPNQLDVVAIGKEIQEWDLLCDKMVKLSKEKKRDPYSSSYHIPDSHHDYPYSYKTNGYSKYDDSHRGLPGGSTDPFMDQDSPFHSGSSSVIASSPPSDCSLPDSSTPIDSYEVHPNVSPLQVNPSPIQVNLSQVQSTPIAVDSETDSDMDVHPELSYQNPVESNSIPDWIMFSPFVPLVIKKSYSSDWKSDLLLCNNSSTPIRHRLYGSSGQTVYLILGAAITPSLRDGISTTQSSYSYSYDFFTDSKWSRIESMKSTSIYQQLNKNELTLGNVDFMKNSLEHSDQNLTTCLDLFSKRNNLDENNKWYCPHCKEHVCAESTTYIDKLPDVLVLQLERFEFIQGYGSFTNRRKISSYISFPIHDLNMSDWLYQKEGLKEEDCIYDLKAICNHSGSSSGGHYYCFACDENEGTEVWNEYNDSYVHSLQETDLIRDTAYVLFYQRRSTRKSTQSMIHFFQDMIDPSKVNVTPFSTVSSEPRQLPSPRREAEDKDLHDYYINKQLRRNQEIESDSDSLHNDPILKEHSHNVQSITDNPAQVDDNIDDVYIYICLLLLFISWFCVGILLVFPFKITPVLYHSFKTTMWRYYHLVKVEHALQLQYWNKSSPDKTVKHVFRLLGESIFSEIVEKERNESVIPICENDGKLAYHLEGIPPEYWSIESLASGVVSYLKEFCEKNTSCDVKNCVLSIPDHFTSTQKEALTKAVQKSGIEVLHVELESICIGYFINREISFDSDLEPWRYKHTLIFNLNESDLSVSIIDFMENAPHLVSSHHSSAVKGEAMVQAIINHMELLVNRSYDADLLNGMIGEKSWQREYGKLFEDVKDHLFFFSQVDDVEIDLPSTCRRMIRRNCKRLEKEPIEEIVLKRADLLSILSEFFVSLSQIINACLAKAGLTVDDIYRVIPVGSFSQLSFITNRLMSIFGKERLFGKWYCDTCVAYGLGEYILHSAFFVC